MNKKDIIITLTITDRSSMEFVLYTSCIEQPYKRTKFIKLTEEQIKELNLKQNEFISNVYLESE